MATDEDLMAAGSDALNEATKRDKGKSRDAIKKAAGEVAKEMTRKGVEADQRVAEDAISRINTKAPPAPRYVDVPTPSFRKGGKVRQTGLARLHRGERVLNRKQTRKYDERKSGR